MEIVHPWTDHFLNKVMEIVHPLEDHFLKFEAGSESVLLSQTCHKCLQPVSRDYYKCKTEVCECGYYLHKECVELKDLPQKYHPLHPQHPLATHYHYPCDKSFVCSFCGEMRQSREFFQCSDDQCDFYLDTFCLYHFMKRPELLDKYEIEHVFHVHENHRLSPHFIDYESNDENCAGCTDLISHGSGFFYKCIACSFSLHTQCAQVPKEAVQHHSHPQHTLVLLQNPPPPSSKDAARCSACLNWIEGGFYLHCNHCPTFNLDLQCYYRFMPTFKHEAHEHPLAYIWRIYDDDVCCYACNTPCNYGSFRCFTCNFNIHFGCHALPIIVNSDDHVDPLTLTTSFKEDANQTAYFCDICEKQRDPDHGIYFCKECTFVAHFECALSLSTAEKEKYADEPWRQKDQEDMTLTNENLRQDILDQLNEEIQKVNDVVKQLTIKEGGGEQLIEKLQEFDERHANTGDILRRLLQNVDLGSLQDTVPTDKIVVLQGGWGLFRKGSYGEILLRLTYKAYVEDEEDDRTEAKSIDIDASDSDDELSDSYVKEESEYAKEADKESFMDVLAALIVSEEFQGIVASEAAGTTKILDNVSRVESRISRSLGLNDESVAPQDSNNSSEPSQGSALFWLAVITSISVLIAINIGGSSLFNP